MFSPAGEHHLPITSQLTTRFSGEQCHLRRRQGRLHDMRRIMQGSFLFKWHRTASGLHLHSLHVYSALPSAKSGGLEAVTAHSRWFNSVPLRPPFIPCQQGTNCASLQPSNSLMCMRDDVSKAGVMRLLRILHANTIQ